MSLQLETLRWLIESAVAVTAAYAVFRLALRARLRAAEAGREAFSPRAWLIVGRSILLASLVLPAAMALLPREASFTPRVRIWSGISRTEKEPYVMLLPSSLAPRPSAAAGGDGLVLRSKVLRLLLAALATWALIELARLCRSVIHLRRRLADAIVVRRRGKVVVRVHEGFDVPFSFRAPGSAEVVLPSALLAQSSDFRLAVSHELQHHRQRDTTWAIAIQALRAMMPWNPALRAWDGLLIELQELACDRALLSRSGISARAYAGCLLRAAEIATEGACHPAGTTGLHATSVALLRRRIHMMSNPRKGTDRGFIALGVAVGTLTLLAGVAFASRGALGDKVVTMSQAKALVDSAGPAEIPLAVNELVLAQLNRFVGTPEGREFIRRGIDRMPIYRKMVESKIAEYRLPAELAAVPLLESGYVNYFHESSIGAGLWGFIKPTARRYGLIVDGTIDERLDEEKATGAAMRYFRDLHRLFGDWRLALKAYNEGEGQVRRLIDELGTTDPWAIEKAVAAKEQYLAKMTAILLILKHPQLLE